MAHIIKSLRPHTVTLREAVGDYVLRSPAEETAALQQPDSQELRSLLANFRFLGFYRRRNTRNNYERSVARIADSVKEAGRVACADCELSTFCTNLSGESKSVWNITVKCEKPGCPEKGLEAAEAAIAGLALRANSVLSGMSVPIEE